MADRRDEPYRTYVRDEGIVEVEHDVPGSQGWVVCASFIVQDGEMLLGALKVVPGTVAERQERLLQRWLDRSKWYGDHPEDPDERAAFLARMAAPLDADDLTAAGVPAGGVTSTVLRRLPLSRLAALARETAASHLADAELIQTSAQASIGSRFKVDPLPHVPALKAFVDAPARTGRAGTDDSYYAVWAWRYANRVGSGSKRPLAELAEAHDIKREVLRDLIHQARSRELLTSSGRGRAGGALTTKAKELLEYVESDNA